VPVSAPIAFLDTETVTLEPGPDVVWEVGVITRDEGRPDQEWLFQLRPNMDRADPESLKISRFEERYQVSRGAQALGWSPPTLAVAGFPPARLTYGAVATTLRALLGGRHIVGSAPNFDTERLSLFMRRHLPIKVGPAEEHRDPWYYHLQDCESLAAGFLRGKGETVDLPCQSEDLSRRIGVEPPDDTERHTALGDADWCRRMWDVVMGGRDG